MATVTCNLTISANSNKGGRLQGNGFGAVTPRLNGGDRLQVVVTWGGSNPPPNELNGYFMCSPAGDAANQSAPSPFLDGGNYVCFQKLVAHAQGQQYTFGSFTVPTGAVAGSYELTIVVEDARTTPTTQWSEDPEFDTTGG